jgi:hypothetical protein
VGVFAEGKGDFKGWSSSILHSLFSKDWRQKNEKSLVEHQWVWLGVPARQPEVGEVDSWLQLTLIPSRVHRPRSLCTARKCCRRTGHFVNRKTRQVQSRKMQILVLTFEHEL